jgi:hypothetical protein
MDELLQKLLEAEVLSEDTKKELEGAFQTKLDEAIEAAKQSAADDVRAELTEQWVGERDTLVEAVDAKVNDFLAREVEELKEDIERFRDLEAEYAEKLVEAKAAMSDELKDDLMELVEKVDAFLEMRLSAEIAELKEDLDAQRQNDFGRRVFEAVAEEYALSFADDESSEATLRETQQRLADTESALEEAESARAEIERVVEMERILSPLSGRQHEVMEAILRTVPTEQLEEGYKTFIGRVIRESEDISEKEEAVLAENEEATSDDKSEKTEAKTDEEIVSEGVVVTGDTEEQLTEEFDIQKISESTKELRKLAGIE